MRHNADKHYLLFIAQAVQTEGEYTGFAEMWRGFRLSKLDVIWLSSMKEQLTYNDNIWNPEVPGCMESQERYQKQNPIMQRIMHTHKGSGATT